MTNGDIFFPSLRAQAKQSISRLDKCGFASSRSLSSGAHSRDPLGPRNDELDPTDLRCPVPTRGALRNVINVERDAVDAGSARDERGLLAYGEVVWFRRPNPWRQACEKKRRRRCQTAWSPRRARISRKTIARGMPGCSGVTVVTNSYACFILHARLL